MRKAVSFFIKLVLLLLILSILFPLGYFAWRAGQPMEMEQFNGISYYEFLSWRKLAYQRLAEQYRAAHPGEKADTPCHELELVVHNAGTFFLGGVIVFAKVYPSLGIQKFIKIRMAPFHTAGSSLISPLRKSWKPFLTKLLGLTLHQ